MRSFLFSMTPHGAIPIVQIFFEDLEQCSLRASPTCLATPSGGQTNQPILLVTSTSNFCLEVKANKGIFSHDYCIATGPFTENCVVVVAMQF